MFAEPTSASAKKSELTIALPLVISMAGLARFQSTRCPPVNCTRPAALFHETVFCTPGPQMEKLFTMSTPVPSGRTPPSD